MGIPYYFYVITKTYDGILLTDIIPDCDNFMLDFNGLIHPSNQKYMKAPAKDYEKGLMTAIWNDTKELIKLVKPKKTVQIYIDGVAPLAKMNQQRKRRFHKKIIEGEWDSNAISPGTTFMTRLHASLRAHIRYSKEDFVYYFSSSDEVGEGEHKLFANIVKGEKTVIYGMDADLIMLALFSHTKDIYLMRENNCLIIDELRKGILKDLKNKYKWNITKEALEDPYHPSAKQALESYGVVCFFLGNDFLPHPISISLKKGGLENILMEAGKLDGFIVTDKDEIVWSYINDLLGYLGTTENEKIFDIVADHYNNKRREVEPDPFEYEMLFKIDRKKWRTYYYKELFYSDSSVIMTSCDLYLKGLLWTYLYYKRKPKDNMWYYPYNYAPTMTDVHNHLNSKLSCYETLEKEWNKKYPKDIFCEQIVQLLSILPRSSIGCLPLKYKKAMENPSLDYLYPTEYKTQTFMKTKLWECSQVLPPMNIELCKSVI